MCQDFPLRCLLCLLVCTMQDRNFGCSARFYIFYWDVKWFWLFLHFIYIQIFYACRSWKECFMWWLYCWIHSWFYWKLFEGGTYACRNCNNIKFPLDVLKILKICLFHLPMQVDSCSHKLFAHKIPMHRKWVRIKCASHILHDALFSFNFYLLCEHHWNHHA